MKSIFLSLILVFASVSSLAKSNTIDQIFADHFYNEYVSGECGNNILNFLRDLRASGVDVGEFSVLSIKNSGYSVFGMVNAEQARRENANGYAVTELNWYYHVVAVDPSGYVYDFDYLTTPTVRHISDYVEHMFLNEPECRQSTYGEFCAGRQTKLSEYEIEVMTAREALGSGNQAPYFTGTLQQTLDRFN
jgi:hypothetical protein